MMTSEYRILREKRLDMARAIWISELRRARTGASPEGVDTELASGRSVVRHFGAFVADNGSLKEGRNRSAQFRTTRTTFPCRS